MIQRRKNSRNKEQETKLQIRVVQIRRVTKGVILTSWFLKLWAYNYIKNKSLRPQNTISSEWEYYYKYKISNK